MSLQAQTKRIPRTKASSSMPRTNGRRSLQSQREKRERNAPLRHHHLIHQRLVHHAQNLPYPRFNQQSNPNPMRESQSAHLLSSPLSSSLLKPRRELTQLLSSSLPPIRPNQSFPRSRPHHIQSDLPIPLLRSSLHPLNLVVVGFGKRERRLWYC